MPTESRSPVSRRKLGIFGAAGVIAALLLVVSGIRAREDSSVKLRQWTDSQAIPSVAVIYPDAGVLSATIDLPGRLEAYYRAPIFARVNGYLEEVLFQEGNVGSLQPGKYADLLVLDRDYLTVPVDSILDIKPSMTMVGGKIVYEAAR